MGLVDLTTDLKSLRYGKDRIGGGSSGQPYIKTDIPDSFSDVGKTGGPDVLLRGGTLTPGRAARDVSRLTQMFFDFKSIGGPLFIAKENILSRTSVATDGKGKALNNGVYLPTSTLLQSAGNPLGLHLNKQGIDPFKGIGKTIIPLSKQRTGLNNPNLNYTTGSYVVGGSIANGFFNLNVYNESKYTSPTDKSDITLSLQSKLGATPKFASEVNDPLTSFNLKTGFTQNTVGNGLNDKSRPDRYNTPTGNNPSIQEDFRTKSDDPKTKAFRLDYTNKNIEQRVGLGNPGRKKTKEQLANYQKGIGELDKINSLRLYKSGVVTSNTDKNDLVKFRIGIIQNDNPSEKIFIHFRAFLDSMSDDYSADWTGERLMGRGEQFYKYNGFDRSISLGWTVVAQSKDELIPMYQKLNYLASTLAPDYSKSLGYMRGNLATLTVGGYLYEQPGIITSLNYNIPEESPWEIAIPTKTGADANNNILSDKSVKEMPHMIKVTGFNFIPIHEFVPRTQQNKFDSKGKLTSFGKERYIALENGVNSNYDSDNYIK